MSGSVQPGTSAFADRLDQIREEIALAMEDGCSTYEADPNSFETGMHEGKVAGLRLALRLMEGRGA